MHAYRSHTCGALRASDAGSAVRLSGWVHRKRDHGGLLFIDLRDHYGLTQLVLHPETPGFAAVERLRCLHDVVDHLAPVGIRDTETVHHHAERLVADGALAVPRCAQVVAATVACHLVQPGADVARRTGTQSRPGVHERLLQDVLHGVDRAEAASDQREERQLVAAY